MIKPRPVKQDSMSAFVKKRIKSLQTQEPLNTRGDWDHFQCFMCEDKSGHMGINRITGQIKCLRCGFTASVQGSGHKSIKIKAKPSIFDNTFVKIPMADSVLDQNIWKYMTGRGIEGAHKYGFGRGDLRGNVVFPVYGLNRKVVYLQYRKISGEGRYRSLPNTDPRLNFYDVVHAGLSPTMLILVEGPVDSCAMTQNTGIWSSFVGGKTIHSTILHDIRQAKKMGLKRILVWLDSERSAYACGRQMADTIRLICGVQAENVNSGFDDGDPASMGVKRTMQILKEYI